MKISRVAEMRQLDKTAIEQFGITDELLMENAGLATGAVILNEFGINNKRFVVFCGIGNNGGDGFVIARKIHSNGGYPKVFILGDRQKFKGPAKLNLDIIARLPIDIREIDSVESLKSDLYHCDAVVDAMLGTGLIRNIEGFYHDVIALINSTDKTVFSVDIPSGVHGDSGKIMGIAVKADYTVTFGLPKIGNMLYPGYEQCGKLFVTHISFPPSMYEDIKIELNMHIDIPPRNQCFHKGDFGNLLCIAGAVGYYGAPYFSALSFLKAGGGYSRLASPLSITPFIAGKGSEIVFIPQEETDSGSISLKNKESLIALSDRMDMVILGPGLSLNEETQALARELAHAIDKPLLIDGDGITALCNDLQIIKQRSAQTILTPHLGEMSRITQVAVSEIEKNKIGLLQQTAKNLNAYIVLKGPHSLIGCPDEKIFINMSGNCGMASAGSGDVLAGTIAAMYTQGLTIKDAIRKGVFIHGLSGDLAAMDKGEDGITAQDILDYLPFSVKADRSGLNKTLQTRYVGAHIV